MKRGDVIGGYGVVSEPTNNGGGKCVWAFAEKDGKEYFLKRFLEPKRPGTHSGDSEATKKLLLEECSEFEDRHRTIMKRLKPDARGAGNIVLAVDFFHEGSTYYKVTERIDTSSLAKPQELAPRQKAVLLRTLGLSLQLLHDIEVVHGDLKPANVLVQKKAAVKSFYTAKLIDFDDSYISGKPPERGIIAGDSIFGAPEWRRYMQGDSDVEPQYLTTKTDIFALGLMTHYYLVGTLPGYGASFGSPADAVSAGMQLRVDDRLTNEMHDLVRDMTSRIPGGRPPIATFLAALADHEICALSRKNRAHGRPPGPGGDGLPGATGRYTPPSRVRTNLDGTSAHRHADAKPRPAATRPGATPPSPAPKPDTGGAAPTDDSRPRRTSRVRINLDSKST